MSTRRHLLRSSLASLAMLLPIAITHGAEEFGKNFNDAIKKSIEQEKADQRAK